MVETFDAMKLWNRRLALSPAVVSRLDLQRGERPLAWARCAGDQWCVGTDRALHLPDGQRFRKLGWEIVERAEWRRDRSTLAVYELSSWGEPEIVTELEIVEAGELLQLVRERVTKSVVITVFAGVRGRRGLTVVGRRAPFGDGPMSWSYVLSQGLDPADELVKQVADRTLRKAEAEVSWMG